MTPSDISHDPRHEAENTAQSARDEAKRAGEEMRSAARDVRDHAADAVRDTGRLAHDEANARVNRAAGSAASEAERAAQAAEDAASDYPDDAMPARALEGVSAFLEDTARGLRETDLDTVSEDVTRFARRNPLTFLAGAAALGFAAARLARATPRDGYADDAYWDDDGYAGPDGGDWPGTSAAEAPSTDPVSRTQARRGARDAPGDVQAQGIGSAAGLRAEEVTRK